MAGTRQPASLADNGTALPSPIATTRERAVVAE
jgi:hypothetical protein